MNRIAETVLLAAVLFLPTLLFAAPLPVNLGVPFALGPGQSAAVIDGDLHLVFTEILTDSRCPQDVVCVWEGDAEAAVVGDFPGGTQIDCVLHTSAMFAQFCDMGTYRVTLLWVDPYPIAAGPQIDPADYIAHFIIVESGSIDVDQTPWGSLKALYF